MWNRGFLFAQAYRMDAVCQHWHFLGHCYMGGLLAVLQPFTERGIKSLQDQ